ncbi:MAG: hypothetical protein JWO95_2643 [Verrucomicrobiales bacterium]|nr:hypothetical protein [Verrucomicrobiales bacterium]
MSVLHVNQIARRVRETFQKVVPQDDLNRNDAELDTKLQTRCLAAYAVQSLTECSIIDAGGAVTDGGDDNGLDAVYYSTAQNMLVLVQSKWIKDGKSEPDSAEVTKFCKGVQDLVNSEFDRFNQKVQRQQSSIENALSIFNCRLQLVLIHTGKSDLAIHATRQIEDLLKELNDATEIASFENIGQERIYSMMAESAAGGAISLEFGLASWGKVEAPHTAFYGMVTGTEVAAWWKQYGERLFAKNLRSVLGATDVNKQIDSTVQCRPDDFWYFNNGITITAKNVEKTLAGGGNRDLGTFRAVGAHIVNGAQTVSTLGRYAGSADNLAKAQIPLRVISLSGAPEDYGALITRTNNTQNRIEARDFVSQDQEQHRFRRELQMEGIEYHLSRSEGFKPSELSFDLEEATVALACATGDATLAALAKREIGRFWLDIDKAPYKRLFNPSVSSLYIYHCVLLYRIVEQRIAEEVSANSRRRGKRYGVLVHGNRLIASIVFRRQQLSPKLGQGGLKVYDHGATLNVLVDETVDILAKTLSDRFSDSFPAVVFKNPTKCRLLFTACVGSSQQLSFGMPLAAGQSPQNARTVH